MHIDMYRYIYICIYIYIYIHMYICSHENIYVNSVKQCIVSHIGLPSLPETMTSSSLQTVHPLRYGANTKSVGDWSAQLSSSRWRSAAAEWTGQGMERALVRCFSFVAEVPAPRHNSLVSVLDGSFGALAS